jgi:hypothetical protein
VVLVSFRRGCGDGGLQWPPVPCPEANSVVQVRFRHLGTGPPPPPSASEMCQVVHVGRRVDYSTAAFERTRQQLTAVLSEHFTPRATRPEDPDLESGGGERVMRDLLPRFEARRSS